eukprot:1193929-Amphidinium_carterae.3
MRSTRVVGCPPHSAASGWEANPSAATTSCDEALIVLDCNQSSSGGLGTRWRGKGQNWSTVIQGGWGVWSQT